jgi:hypothetical protein
MTQLPGRTPGRVERKKVGPKPDFARHPFPRYPHGQGNDSLVCHLQFLLFEGRASFWPRVEHAGDRVWYDKFCSVVCGQLIEQPALQRAR